MAGSQLRRDQIRALTDQWEAQSGYQAAIPDWMIEEMSGMGTQSLYDVGQYMSRHISQAGQDDGAHPWDLAWAIAMPWAAYGLDHIQYQSMFNNANTTFEQLTGKAIDNWTFDHFLVQSGGNLTSAGLKQSMLADDAIMAAYGWIRFGLDFQQFQQQKIERHLTFMDDAQAVLQLQYSQRNQGSNMEVQAQPTLSQQEKKTTNVGVGQSEVR